MKTMARLALPAALVVALALGGTARADCPDDVGAALAAACPCDGQPTPAGPVAWKNHGQYVRCVVQLRNELRKAGCLDDSARRTIARCAARSTCGKPGAVLCCFYTPGTCEGDPLPGDGTAAGTCSTDDGLACDVDADCTLVRGPKLARGEERCTKKGGTPVGAGSICAGCPAL
jgi:hypothetical protein